MSKHKQIQIHNNKTVNYLKCIDISFDRRIYPHKQTNK